jgi:hypothetical protein
VHARSATWHCMVRAYIRSLSVRVRASVHQCQPMQGLSCADESCTGIVLVWVHRSSPSILFGSGLCGVLCLTFCHGTLGVRERECVQRVCARCVHHTYLISKTRWSLIVLQYPSISVAHVLIELPELTVLMTTVNGTALTCSGHSTYTSDSQTGSRVQRQEQCVSGAEECAMRWY